MTYDTRYLIKITNAAGGVSYAHTCAGKLCEYERKEDAQRQITRLLRKANAGRVARETFEPFAVYY